MKTTLLQRVINTILLRTDSVDDLLKVFNKTQRKLTELTARLEALAKANEAEAQRRLEEAKAQSAEAQRATQVAKKLNDLTA